MMTSFEAIVALRAFAGPQRLAQVSRIFATRDWVRASCERDCLPTWLMELVMQRVERDLLADDFPLIELTEGERSEHLAPRSEQITTDSEQSIAPMPDFWRNIATRADGSNRYLSSMSKADDLSHQRQCVSDSSLAKLGVYTVVVATVIEVLLSHITWK